MNHYRIHSSLKVRTYAKAKPVIGEAFEIVSDFV